jgi:UDP-N-acetylglucosamine 2-epimerase (non-hydrolysing)
VGVDRRINILTVVGTRPNLMKTAPIVAELERRSERFRCSVVHTGQHYDAAMSGVFLEELGMDEPDHFLQVGSGSHAQQTARVMERLEPVLLDEEPDAVLVPGDVNSTLAAAIAASKLGVPVAHVEAGLRSFDRTMPEELNRIVTDQLSDLLFTHSPEAEDNLLREGRPATAIHYVGNTMIDTLVAMLPRIRARGAAAAQGLEPESYVIVTLHRPALVDDVLLGDAVEQLRRLALELPVVFPVHPRTRRAMEAHGLDSGQPGLRLLEPLGYLDFLGLVGEAAAVLTDSGGIQEESTFLGVPCFTLRDNTERPVTVELGTNTLLGLEPARIADIPELIGRAPRREPGTGPPLWDGHAAGRIVDVLESLEPAAPAETARVG